MDFSKTPFVKQQRAFFSLWEASYVETLSAKEVHILHLSFARIISENVLMYLFLCNL